MDLLGISFHGLLHPERRIAGPYRVVLVRDRRAEERHRSLEIGEEDRDLLPLTFERGLRREDAFGEVLRRVRLGSGKPRHRRGRRGSRNECKAAAIAELAPGLDLRAAAPANCRECCAALATEAGPVAVIGLAPGTLHAEASRQ